MKILIEATGMSLTPSLKADVENKLGSLDKYFPDTDAVELRVEIGIPSAHHRKGDIFYAEANLKMGGRLLRATAENHDMYMAIDEAKHILERQIAKFKDKQVSSQRRTHSEK